MPERRAYSAMRKVEYERQMRMTSSAGGAWCGEIVRRSTSLKSSAMAMPPKAPMATEPRKMRQKAPMAEKTWPAPRAPTPSCVSGVVSPTCTTVLKRTIATASLSTLSPKMSALSFGSAPVEEKTASVATGSTATMSAAKAHDSIGVSRPRSPPRPK